MEKLQNNTNLIVVKEDFVYNKEKAKYDLAKVKEFEKLADFSESDATLRMLPELEKIGGIGLTSFYNSNIKRLPKLTYIGGAVDFSYSKIENLSELTSVGGYANFAGTPIKHLPKLKTIFGYASFEGTLIKELRNLEVVNGAIFIDKNNLIAMPKLKVCDGGICLCDYAEKGVYYSTVDQEYSHLVWIDKKCSIAEYNELVKKQNKK